MPLTNRRHPADALHGRRALNALLRTPLATALAAPHGVDPYLQLVDPVWSVHRVRARVVAVVREAGDAVSLWLMPNENWRGFRAGQFVRLSAWIGGVRHTRCFSLSSAPEDGVPVRITIKLLPGGRISSWAIREARAGDVVELSPALGDFVLPEPTPRRLLFISGGSGITPIVSMLRHLAARGMTGEIRWLHYARHEVILGEEIAELRRHAGDHFAVRLIQTSRGAAAPRRRFSREALASWIPGYRDYETFVCGPDPLREAVTSVWHGEGLARRLHVERFAAPRPVLRPGGAEGNHRVVFARQGREVRGHQGGSLLEQAERAGLEPAYGCRAGVCQSCRCIKRSGVVRNELTGTLDEEQDTSIQLCISTACSDVTLDL